MSILIRGMEMPKSCSDCFYEYETLKGETCCAICNGSISNDESFSKRIPSCPLVEIPPHGRLIDADELKSIIESYLKIQEDWAMETVMPDCKDRAEAMVTAYINCVKAVEKMPTVIEAEEET